MTQEEQKIVSKYEVAPQVLVETIKYLMARPMAETELLVNALRKSNPIFEEEDNE